MGGIAFAGSPTDPSPVQTKLDAIEKRLRKGERSEAITSLAALVHRAGDQTSPASIDAHVLYQDLLLASGKRDEITKSYKARHRELGTAESQFLYARTLQGRRKVSELKRVTKRAPDVGRYWTEYALALRKVGRTDLALAAARQGVKLQARSSRGQEILGWVLERDGQTRKAEKCYRTAIELRSENVRARFKLAQLLVRSRRGREALKTLEQAEALAPGDPKVYINRGLVFAALKKPRNAAKAYQMAVERAPNDALVLVLLAEAYAELSQWDLAGSTARKAVELDPKLAAAHSAGGYVAWRQGEHEVAEKAYKRAIRLAPKNARYYFYLGLVCEQQDKYADAERYLKRAVFCSPDAPVYRLALGRSLERSGRPKDALRVYRTATLKFPSDADSWSRYGHVAADMQKYKEAERAFVRALDIDPNDTGALLSLGTVFEIGLRKPDTALRCYKDYVAAGGKDRRVKDWILKLQR